MNKYVKLCFYRCSIMIVAIGLAFKLTVVTVTHLANLLQGKNVKPIAVVFAAEMLIITFFILRWVIYVIWYLMSIFRPLKVTHACYSGEKLRSKMANCPKKCRPERTYYVGYYSVPTFKNYLVEVQDYVPGIDEEDTQEPAYDN